jgi:hypothetical protein
VGSAQKSTALMMAVLFTLKVGGVTLKQPGWSNRLLKNCLLCGPWKARQIAQAQKAKQFEQYGKTTLLPYCG